MTKGSILGKRERERGEKNPWKSWKQILVEHWTSHYFSLCLQMLLATVSSAKGQNKGACHRTTQPNPTSPPTPRLPPQRSPSPFFFFSLFFFHFECSTFITSHPTYHPPVLLFLLPSSSPSPCSSSTTFASPSSLSSVFLHLSLPLFFYARVLITGSRTG